MRNANRVLGSLLGVAGAVVAQAPPVQLPINAPAAIRPARRKLPPKPVAADDEPRVPVVIAALRPRVFDAQSEQLLSVWGQCAALRRKLGLPAKAPNAHLAGIVEPRADAMRHVSLGLAAVRQAALRAADAKRDSASWQRFVEKRNQRVLRHFVTAIVRDPASIDALLALANTSHDLLVARLALRAVDRAALAEHATERSVALVSVLLDHSSPAVASMAFSHLEFLLDANVPDAGVYEQLAERAKHVWPASDRDLKSSHWGPKRVFFPARARIATLPPPGDSASRLIVLSALHADQAVLDRLIKGDFDARILLHAHCLAAPRADRAFANQLFLWYRKHVPKWKDKTDHGVNAWKFGVVSILVSVLPRLDEKSVHWYRKHLLEDDLGVAVKSLALHRLACLQRVRQQDWFRLPSDVMDAMAVADVLSIWRYFGADAACTLAGCLRVAPRASTDKVTRHYYRSVLRSAPMASAGEELDLLASLWHEAKAGVAHAVVERALRHGEVGRAAVHGWLRDAVSKRQRLSATALELAVAHDLPLPRGRRWPEKARQLRAMQALSDAFASKDQGELRKLLQVPPVATSPSHMRVALHATTRLADWSPAIAMFVARATTDASPVTRRIAYGALASAGAQAHEVSWLAQEAAFDVDIDVRR